MFDYIFFIFIVSVIIICISFFIIGNKHLGQDKGEEGERIVANILGKNIENEKYVFNNYTFRSGKTTVQIDHILVNKNGIFVIETKNISGRITISKEGNWIHKTSNGEEKGMRNPSQQVYRHEVLLKSFLPKDTPIISLICLANPELIIEGQENSKVPVLKSDIVTEFIVDYRPTKLLSLEEMKALKNLISQHYSD